MRQFKDFHQNPVERPAEEKIYWRISGYAAVLSKGNELLLMKPRFDPSKWVFPGGKIEVDENIKDGIERECYEETGYLVQVDVTHPAYCGESSFYDSEEKIFFHSIILIYPGRLISQKQEKEAIMKDEVESVDWVPLNQLNEKNCHPVMYPALKNLK